MYQEMAEHIYVVKRNGERVPVSFDEILQRIRSLSDGLNHVNPDLIAQKVCNQLMDGIKTSELDEFAAETCAMMQARYHPNYGKLAARIVISNHQKNTPSTLLTCTEALYHGPTQIVSEEHHDTVCRNASVFQNMIDYSRDYMFDYFGFKTLEKGYLLKQNGVLVERPQHMWMRVAIQLHGNNVEKVKETYDALSQGYFIHATPTLFNSGTNHPQLSSCFLLTMNDSITEIYKTLADCAQISKWSGGIGLSIHNIRARGSKIRGTNGESTGIVPMLRVFNDTAKYVNQGGKRNGSFAIYLEPWHADIEDFLRLKLNQGAEEDRARDLFYGLWIPDLFMKRLEQDKDWTLMCPDECPGLADCWGTEFETLYESYEKAGKGRSTIPAKKLWQMILDAQIQTGTPYLCYKDAANSKSNQQHLGTIKSSNLCTEVIEYTSPDETAVCNLGSLALPKFVKYNNEKPYFDFDMLREYTRILTRNLDIVIDKNYYPTKECSNSNMKHRPIGIGVQGLADVFAMMRYPWTSEDASKLNREIFENIYFASVDASVNRAVEMGTVLEHFGVVDTSPFPSFKGSPTAYGQLQYDLWKDEPRTTYLDWDLLKRRVKNGIRNSLLVAPMPTASTSQILGNNECFEPFTTNLYARRVLAGDFMVVNKYLVEDLTKLGLWTSDVRTQIVANNGSIQSIQEIPEDLRELYKTAWEIPQKTIINMARDRAPFICQSQSLNLFLAEPTYAKISSMHVYAWKQGLKTGCYYLRTKAVASAQKFTVEPPKKPEPECLMCSA
jgi:ribonucleoside-diphosphate reductase alpha subunit